MNGIKDVYSRIRNTIKLLKSEYFAIRIHPTVRHGQGCIIIRGYPTVYVEPLNKYWSFCFWTIPSSANFDFVFQHVLYVRYVRVPHLRQQVSNPLCILFWRALQLVIPIQTYDFNSNVLHFICLQNLFRITFKANESNVRCSCKFWWPIFLVM